MLSNPPPTTQIRWFNVAILTITPAVTAYGLWAVEARRGIVGFSIVYYIFSMLGEHRNHLLTSCLTRITSGITAGERRIENFDLFDLLTLYRIS